MARPFKELREDLLRAGVARRHVRRYLAELGDHLADLRVEEEKAGRNREEAESAALARLGAPHQLALAMVEQRQFQAWSARAPWAVFVLVPACLLAVSWLVACFILWSGWHVFLQGSPTPFVRVHGLAEVYFGIGRMIYYWSPVLIGWAIALIAVRQRLKAGWPVAGLASIALIGATARVHAGHPTGSVALGHVSMDFAFGSTVPEVSQSLSRAMVLLLLSMLPYFIWRLKKVLPPST